MYSRKQVVTYAAPRGLRVTTYSPGDGVTRYRFHYGEEHPDYFASPHPVGTVLGAKNAMAFIDAFTAGYNAKPTGSGA